MNKNLVQFGIQKPETMTAQQAIEAAVQLLRSKGHTVGETELLDDGETDVLALIDVDVELPCWLSGNGVEIDAEAP